MTLFDGNYHVLLVKNEMQKPQDFTKIAITSMTLYSIICFLVGFLSYIGMGNKMLSPVTENVAGDYQILGSKVFLLDSNSIYYLKIISVLCMFAACFLYSMAMFISL
jgi:amino acid permease